MIARLGQARIDRVMTLSALSTISLALAPIAEAVPELNSDVTVEVTQLVQPLGLTIEKIIAPFFAENDYNHFKTLKDQLDINLQRPHRTQPVFVQ